MGRNGKIMKIVERAKSNYNRDIELIEQSSEKYEMNILFIGIVHGDEQSGEYLINRFIKSSDETKFKNRLLYIPCLNPDGKHAGQRTNGLGIDLNRNFPSENWEFTEDEEYFGGPKGGSEPETQFVIDVVLKYRPDLIVTLHEPYEIVNYDGPAKIFALKISELTGYIVQEDIGYPTPGSLGTYFGVERNIPVITLELPEDEDPEVLWQTNKKMFEYFAY